MSTKGYRKPGAKREIISIRLTEDEMAAVDYVRGDATRGAVMKHNTMASIVAEYEARVFVPSGLYAHGARDRITRAAIARGTE